MVHIIENEYLTVSAENYGAELNAITGKSGTEYLYKGNTAFWQGRAPVLFPIVGRLNGGKYSVNGKHYELPGHGFGRSSEFSVIEKTSDYITFELNDSPETMKVYPYPFNLQIKYSLDGYALETEYTVTNTGEALMYFSIGGHPAFYCPLEEGESFDDYYIEFSQAETAGVHSVDGNGLVSSDGKPFLQNQTTIPLKHSLFENDALVFTSLKSESVALKSKKGDKSVVMDFPGFPFFGIWTKPGAPYVCLEPWCGIADIPGFCGDISEKKGIMPLEPGKSFVRAFSVKFH